METFNYDTARYRIADLQAEAARERLAKEARQVKDKPRSWFKSWFALRPVAHHKVVEPARKS